MQQSIRGPGGRGHKKQSTCLDNEEEKANFTFVFFSSFNAAIIAARMEVETAVAGGMERTIYGYGRVTTNSVATEEGPRPTRTLERSGHGGVGHKG